MPPPEEDNDAGADSDYTTNMLRCLRDVNVDNNTVGWYQSTLMNSWLDPDSPFIETQYEFQCSVPKSVCLIYDPVRTSSGSVHLKAYRLTDKFFKKYKVRRMHTVEKWKQGVHDELCAPFGSRLSTHAPE